MNTHSEMDGEVQLFDVMPANQPIRENYYDDDNFYPSDLSNFNGAGEYETSGGGSWTDGTGTIFQMELGKGGSEQEYSELFGIDFSKFKNSSKKQGGQGFFKTLGEQFKARGGGKAARQTARGTKRSERRANRLKRKNERQVWKMQKVGQNPVVGPTLKVAADANPTTLKPAVDAMADGQAQPQAERLVDETVKIIATGGNMMEELGAGLGLDLSGAANTNAQLGGNTGDGADDGKDDTKGWAGLSTGAKIGIGIGGAVVIGGIVFMIVKMSSKKSA